MLPVLQDMDLPVLLRGRTPPDTGERHTVFLLYDML